VFVVLTLIFGVLNVCLGYAVAVQLGYGPPRLWGGAWMGPAREWAVEAPEPEEPSSEQFMAAMLDDGDEEGTFGEPYIEPYDDDVADLLDPDNPEAWYLNEKYIETSILKLNVAMMKSGAKATEIDTRLRSVRGHTDLETIRWAVEELKEDCRVYLAQQGEASEKFHNRIDELGELASLGEEIEMANLEQSAQIETTINNLGFMDLESDPEAANTRLLEEINNLRMARHRLRDSHETAFLTVARYEGRLKDIEPQLFNDPVTGLRNRTGLETALAAWFEQKRHHSRQMSAALFDIDAFGHVNEVYGSLIGDRILHHLARVIEESADKSDLVGRFAGQQFLRMLVDVGPRAAIKSAETLRQTIERVTFRSGAAEIRVTVGCAITEVKPEDTEREVFQRLGAALKAAKRAGPNRCCVFDRREPEPVESPNFGAEYQEFVI